MSIGPIPPLALTFGCLMVAAGPLVLLFLVRRQLRKPVDTHPHCRRCGYDVFGLIGVVQDCPECGSDLVRHPGVRIGSPLDVLRRRQRWIRTSSLFTLFLLTYAVGAAWWTWAEDTGWQKLKPVWWLRAEVNGHDRTAEAAAWAELHRRLADGELANDDIATLLDSALALDLNLTDRWNRQCYGFLKQAHIDGHLPATPWRKFNDRLVNKEQLLLRSPIRAGDPLIAKVATRVCADADINPLVTASVRIVRLPDPEPANDEASTEARRQRKAEARAERRLGRHAGQADRRYIAINEPPKGQPAAHPAAQPAADPAAEAVAPPSIPPSPETATLGPEDDLHHRGVTPQLITPPNQPPNSPLRVTKPIEVANFTQTLPLYAAVSLTPQGGQPIALPAGRYEIEMELTGSQPAQKLLKLVSGLEVVAADTPTVRLIRDAGIRRTIRSQLAPPQVKAQCGPYGCVVQTNIAASTIPVPVAFDIELRRGEETWTVDVLVLGHCQYGVDAPGFMIDLPRFDASLPIDVALVPNPDLAVDTLDVYEIWGEPIVFEDITIAQ